MHVPGQQLFDSSPVSSLSVEGATIRYRRVGDASQETVLLVHGGAANAAWWMGVLPDMAERYELLLTDLSGHGLSDHRDDYSPRLWARELGAVLEAEVATRATVVGHSMGGFVTVFLCAYEPERVSRAILVDSGLRSPGVDGDSPRGRKRRTANRVYRDLDEALGRFRLVPEQPVVRREFIEPVARASLMRVEGGWTWRFDPQVFQRFTDAALAAALREVQRPLSLIYGEQSPGCGPGTVEFIRTTSGLPVPTVAVPGAYHHVPLDQPERTADALRELLDAGRNVSR